MKPELYDVMRSLLKANDMLSNTLSNLENARVSVTIAERSIDYYHGEIARLHAQLAEMVK